MSEKAFASHLSMKHNQHLEAKRTLKFTYSEGDAEQVEKALDIIGRLTGFTERPAQLLAWAIDCIGEHDNDGDKGDSAGVSEPFDNSGIGLLERTL